MITILSPAKTLDFDSTYDNLEVTTPDFVDESAKIISKLRKLSKKKVGSLMSVSPELAKLNVDRYAEWSTLFTPENSRPAILTFSGDVYRGMDNKSFSADDLEFANSQLRLLSGLHGVLKPLDQIQPYRLEMGTRISVGRKKNLYQFWSDRVTESLNKSIEQVGTDTLVNLASNEYSKVVDLSKIKGKVVTPIFMDNKNGDYKVVMTWAKLARGMMAGFIVRNRITAIEDIKSFKEYQFDASMSSDSEWVFTRG